MGDDIKQSGLLFKNETAEYLTISVRKLERLMVKGEITYYRFGRSVRFCKADLDDWIKKHRIKPRG